MKIKQIILLALVAFFGISPMSAQDQIKIVTWNIRSFEPNFDCQPYAEAVWNEHPDVICLNEVENRSSRQMIDGKYRDVVEDFANRMHMFGLFGYSYNLSNKKGELPEENYKYSENEMYGNAIVSRFPILNVSTIQLPRPAGSADQRGVVVADLLMPSGKIVRVACSHLDHIGGQMEQAEVLTTDKVLSSEYPTLLCGDFNKGAGSDVLNKLLTVYDRMDGDEGTYLGYSKIDFILGAKGKFSLVESRTIDRNYNGQELSDHNAVVSVVEIK